jgi:DNA-3-methyladenine glycosylase
MTQPADFLQGNVVAAARRLLGSWLVRTLDGVELVGRIVETEAYHQTDAASHSYKGRTPRTDVMFGPAGRAYVYFTYGMHYCMNVVTGTEGEGSAVLIRAIEPVTGTEIMRYNRGGMIDVQLTNGPAKLCQALQIDKAFNGHNLGERPLQLLIKPPLRASRVSAATRVGISRDTHRLWRFYESGNSFVSKRG